jgi:hypothetical protein
MGPVIVLAGSEVPTELLGRGGLRRREHAPDSGPEFRFALSDPWPRVPIRRYGTVDFARWGNLTGRSRALPRAALTRLERVEAGDWSRYGGLPVEVAANFWVAGGAWCYVEQGIRGVLAPDELGWAVCYVVCEPASNTYRNMTRQRWMPVFIGQRY